jgi:hypothetical protein
MTLPARLALTLLVTAGAAAWCLAAVLLWLILADPLRAMELASALTG